MRAISLVNCFEFDFHGNVLKNAFKLGDVDNDGNNELVIGNDSGELVIFKELEKFQTIKDLGFISCVAIGDILNEKRNCLVVIGADGWCYIYSTAKQEVQRTDEEGIEEVDGPVFSGSKLLSSTDESQTSTNVEKDLLNHLQLIHTQRIPANTKDVLLADVDGDGLVEMVLGLTDRVVRSYRWYGGQNKIPLATDSSSGNSAKAQGKLIGLNKWECANQIGSITLHHNNEGAPSLLIAQPGGTFMRIYCLPDALVNRELESKEKDSSSSSSESMPGSTIDYQFLGLSRMRNQNISTEIVGNLKVAKSSIVIKDSEIGTSSAKCIKNPYVVATLDGTIILVQDEVILWAMAVDHQVFALNKMDVTGNGADDIVACAWDGQTYILDQEKNAVRFQLDEAVQAFDCGYYTLDSTELPLTCFAYVTFRNKILVYYDIQLKEMISKKFEPNLEKLSNLLKDSGNEEGHNSIRNLDRRGQRELVEYLLYGVNK